MSRIVKVARVAGPLLVTALVVSACSGGAKTAGSVGPDTSSPSPAAGGQGNGGQRQAPGVSGLVADLQGSTLQVQSTTAQTTVTFSGTTTFTDTTAATAADVKVGVCVTALPAFTQGAAPSPSADGSVAAATVTITQPVDGRCDLGGFGGGGGRGAFPSGAARPSFVRPSGGARPSGRRGGFGAGGFGTIASGTVASVTGTGFTVTETRRGFGGAGGAAPSASPTPTTVTVTTSSSTTYTKTAPSTSAAVKTGVCVTALGQADSTGAVAARSIAVRPATNGVCTETGRGFGGGFPGGGGPGGPGAPAGGPGA